MFYQWKSVKNRRSSNLLFYVDGLITNEKPLEIHAVNVDELLNDRLISNLCNLCAQ